MQNVLIHIHIYLQPITILDWRDDSGISDNLYIQSDRSSGCTRSRCSGSKMNTVAANRPLGLDTAITQARDFLNQYYKDTVNHDKPEKSQGEREREVLQQLRYLDNFQSRKRL